MEKVKMKCKTRLAKKMVFKSLEAFTYAIETFNKPTITYRVESFAYLICNAWELLLKAYWLETKGKHSIYYPDNPDRTFSIDYIVKKTFTNENDPVRKNLEEIIKLRNLSTHYITEEYEVLYAPFFQSCVLNYIDKADDYFGININELIKYPFLSISTFEKVITPESFKRRYGKELFNRYMQRKESMDKLLETPNNKLALSIDINVALIKDPHKADVTMAISKNASNSVTVIKETRDVNKYYPFNQKRGIKALNDRLAKAGISVTMNQYSFQLICKYFNLYEDPSMCYHISIDAAPRKVFSNKMIDFMFAEISKDPHIISHLKERIKNKPTSGAREF